MNERNRRTTKPRPARPTIVYRIGVIRWVPCTQTEAEWYYHAAEGQVYPNVCYPVMHKGHAVMPVRPL